ARERRFPRLSSRLNGPVMPSKREGPPRAKRYSHKPSLRCWSWVHSMKCSAPVPRYSLYNGSAPPVCLGCPADARSPESVSKFRCSYTRAIMDPKTEKLALFIDGANLYATAKSLGFDIDYKRLLREFQSRGYLLRAFYYTAVIEDQEYSSIRPLIDW